MAATEPIKDKAQLKQLAAYFLERGQLRNYVMIVLGTCTALRISDTLQFKWDDVYDEKRGVFYPHVALAEKKTGKGKSIALKPEVVDALGLYYPHRRGRYIFANNRKDGGPISRMQAWRIIHAAAEEIGITGKVGCHSMRKSWGYHAWTSGEVSPVVIMDVFNHSNYEITRRYLGVAQDDLDRAYLGVSIFGQKETAVPVSKAGAADNYNGQALLFTVGKGVTLRYPSAALKVGSSTAPTSDASGAFTFGVNIVMTTAADTCSDTVTIEITPAV